MREFRVVQDRIDHLTVSVVPDPAFGAAEAAAIRTQFTALLGPDTAVEVVAVPSDRPYRVRQVPLCRISRRSGRHRAPDASAFREEQRSMSDPLKICVVGTGHIGLPLAAVLADAGFSVIGYDTNDDFVTRVNTTGTVDFQEEGLGELLAKHLHRGLTLTSTPPDGQDVYVITVGTPLEPGPGAAQPRPDPGGGRSGWRPASATTRS